MALPSYKNYIIRVRIAEIINNYTLIMRDIQLALASSEVLSHEYTGDRASSRGSPDFQKYVGFCYDNTTVAKELHWNNKAKIAKVTGVDATYVRQFILLTYEPDTTGYCRHNSHTELSKLYSTVAFVIDYQALGIDEIYKNPSSGHNSAYKANEVFVMTIGGTVDYFDKHGGKLEKTTEHLSVSCGVQSTAGYSKMNLLYSYIPNMCRYYSEWNNARRNRRLFPLGA